MEIDYEAIKARLRRQQERDDARAIEKKKIEKTVRHAERMSTKSKWSLDSIDKPKKKKKSVKAKIKAKSTPGLCNKCKLPIAWKKLDNGKWCPTNPDGSDHWDDCSATRNKTPGTDRIMSKSSGWRTGRDYTHTPSDKLPWED